MLFGGRETTKAAGLVMDPVCKMEIDPSRAYYTQIGGKTYYFCRPRCKAEFKSAQNKVLSDKNPFKNSQVVERRK